MPPSSRTFVIEVMLHDDRWHGHSEWPPAPFRLFQALVAAAARGRKLEAADEQALQWLEALEPPVIVAPRLWRRGQPVQTYVPNNDLDAVGGNPDLVEKVRAPKRTQPCLLQDPPRFLYIWPFEMKNGVHAPSQRLLQIARRLYQFGRGVDMAWARAQVLTSEEAQALLRTCPGLVHEPCGARGERLLPVPVHGSLNSLQQRFVAFRHRLKGVREGRSTRWHFRQPPKPVRRMVGYACAPQRLLLDIRRLEEPKSFAATLQRHIAPFTRQLRDMAAKRLLDAGADAGLVERFLIGRNADAQDKKRRVRIIPLPSIGHEFAGGAIRRVLVEVPAECPLPAEDVQWAFTGECFDPGSGELTGQILVPATDMNMLRHYGIGERYEAVRWRSITPVALPITRHGRKGSEREHVEKQAMKAVCTALRHAGVRVPVARVHVQREPFDRNSHMANTYRADRFGSQQLWHVEIVFEQPVAGPLIMGNGRYMGLGLMYPLPTTLRNTTGNWRDAFTFELLGPRLQAEQAPKLLATARAALMRLDAELHRNGETCLLFSGHEEMSSAPAREGYHAHVFLNAAADETGHIRYLHVLAPWLVDHSAAAQAWRRGQEAHFAEVVGRLQQIYASGLGRFTLLDVGSAEHLRGPGTQWHTVTPYVTTRRWRRGRDEQALVQEDVLRECVRRGLPHPVDIQISAPESLAGARLSAWVTLRFAAAVQGPLVLGWRSHVGSGLFVAQGEGLA